MAELPTPQALALELVQHLVKDGATPGNGTTVGRLRTQFGNHRPSWDFEAGLAEAVRAGWVQWAPGENFVFLTAEGFAAA